VSSQLEGLGQHRELPQRSPSVNAFGRILKATYRTLLVAPRRPYVEIFGAVKAEV